MTNRDKIPQTVVEQVKEQIDLSALISSYIPLKRFKALCPFHTEKTPSFVINPNKKFWHCFGCGAAGDVISFVQKMEGISFSDAVNKLAIQAGIPLPKSTRFQSFINRRFELIKQQLPKLAYCRDVLKDFEKLRYSELRAEWRGLLLKEDKDAYDYLRMDLIEFCFFDKLNAFIRKVEKILDDLEKEVRLGKYL